MTHGDGTESLSKQRNDCMPFYNASYEVSTINDKSYKRSKYFLPERFSLLTSLL